MKRHCVALLFLVFVYFAGASGSFGQVKTTSALAHVGSMKIPFAMPGNAFALWQRGSFVYVTGRFSASPVFQFLDRDGHVTSTFTFSIPKASLINLYDNSVALGQDGSLAITGTAYLDDSREGMFLAWVSPDRREQTIIRISPFFPKAVTLASDGTIWLAGDETKPNHQAQDYTQHLLRHYDKTGKLLGSFLTWADFQTDSPYIAPTLGSTLLPLEDGIGWYSFRSKSYVELSSDGSVVRRLKTGPHSSHDLVEATACADGDIYASTRIPATNNPTESNWGIYTLDPTKGTWTVQPTGDKWGRLFGCDGTRLVTTSDFKTVAWLSRAGQ
jgi:hypothetical protein